MFASLTQRIHMTRQPGDDGYVDPTDDNGTMVPLLAAIDEYAMGLRALPRHPSWQSDQDGLRAMRAAVEADAAVARQTLLRMVRRQCAGASARLREAVAFGFDSPRDHRHVENLNAMKSRLEKIG